MPAVKDAGKKIDALREKIRHHEYRYFVLDDPEISDLDFDKLMKQLKDLEAEHPFSCHTGLSIAARGRQAARRLRQGPPLVSDVVARQHLQRRGTA